MDMRMYCRCGMCGDRIDLLREHPYVICDNCLDGIDLAQLDGRCRLIPTDSGFMCSKTFDAFRWKPGELPNYCPHCGRRTSW